MEEFEMKKLLIALLFVISLTSFSTMVNLPIKSVEVVNNQQVPASLIKETLKLKEGAKFSTEALLADFNALKETGYFEDVILQPISYDGGVRIAPHLKKYWRHARPFSMNKNGLTLMIA